MSHQAPNEGSDALKHIVIIPEGTPSLRAINEALNHPDIPPDMDLVFVRNINLTSKEYTMDDYDFLRNDIRKVQTFLYHFGNPSSQVIKAVTEYLKTQVRFLHQMRSMVFKRTDLYEIAALTPPEIAARANDGVTRVMRKTPDKAAQAIPKDSF